MMLMANQRGFTIVELLIVIVVIAILASITIVAYSGVRDRSTDAEKASIFNTVHTSLENFYTEKNRYPASDEMASNADLEQLGLTQEAVVPADCNLSWGVRLGWVSSASCNLTYIAHPNRDGSGFQCMKPTVCRHYTLSYWSKVNNQAVTIRNGQ
jgi:prepilin-type N-terminal cleavage/methylation domain-containing protein